MILSSPSSTSTSAPTSAFPSALRTHTCASPASSRLSIRSHHECPPKSSLHLLSASITHPPPSASGRPVPPYSPSRSRLARGIDEIRTALKRQTVNPGSPSFSPDASTLFHRGVQSAMSSPAAFRGRATTVRNGNGNGNSNKKINNSSIGGTMVNFSPANNSNHSNHLSTSPGILFVPSKMSSGGARSKRSSSAASQPPRASPQEQPPSEADRLPSKRIRSARPSIKLLPRRYERADPSDLVVLISSMLMELIRYNDKIPLHEGRLTRFHSRTPPRISVQDYLQRLTTHATLPPPILLSMVYYIDRLCALYPAFTVSSLTVHRFLIASATVASKGLSDSFWTNKTYARVGGISVAELALLELEFLWRVEWRIVPQPEVLVDYYLSLVERCEGYQLEPDSSPPAMVTTVLEGRPSRKALREAAGGQGDADREVGAKESDWSGTPTTESPYPKPE